MTWREALSPLRHRPFAWFFASRVVNLLGLTMAGIALSFAVLDLTGSATDLGLVLAAHTVPLVLFLLAGGVIADRWPRAVVVRVASLGTALAQGILAFLVVSDAATLPTMMALSAVTGTMSAVTLPALSAMTPQLAPPGSLQQANALISLARGGMAVLGPTIGALLVVGVGAGWALAADALAWALAAALLAPVRVPSRAATDAAGSHLSELREGWIVFRSTPWLWRVVLGFGVLNALHAGAWFTLGPAQARETIGERGWGLVLSAESLGLVLMTLVLMRVPLQRPLMWGMGAIASFALPLVLMGSAPVLPLLLAAALVAGAGMEVFSMGWNLAMQENIEEHQLSRAYSYDALGSFAAIPVGQALFGPLGEAVGYGPILVGAGVVWVAVCALVLASPAVRRLPRRTSSTPSYAAAD